MRRQWERVVPDHFRNVHDHVFEKGTSELEKQTFMQESMEMCQGLGIEAYCRKTDGGYQFAFENVQDYGAFVYFVLDDLKGNLNHTQISSPPEGGDMHPDWMESAESLLQFFGIEYECEMKNGEAVFKFNKMSDRLFFAELVDGGHVQHHAEFMELKRRNEELRQGMERRLEEFKNDGPSGLD